MENLNPADLIHMLPVRELLINYMYLNYEEAADISDESLLRELIWLKENDRLWDLIEASFINSAARSTGG